MKVKVVYRNYIPLYSGYCSFWLNPVDNVEVFIPKVKSKKLLFRIYRLLRGLPLFSTLVSLGQKIFFRDDLDSSEVDLFFFAGMLPKKEITKPFVVDFEHVHSLFDYAVVNKDTKEKVWRCLNSTKCIGILPWSEAALNTLKRLYEDRYADIEGKVRLLYPALPIYKEIYSGKENFEFINKNKSTKFIFVGRDCRRKGLVELLTAFSKLSKENDKAELYVVSDIDDKTKQKFEDPKIFFWEAKFSQEDMVKKFFLTGDVLVMPTHADTFGMVILEAMSCGIPVIATDQFASREIVEDGENGLFVESTNLFLDQVLIPDKKHTGEGYNQIDKILVDDLYVKMKYLVDNPKKLLAMKKKATGQFDEGGRFSIRERNKKLKEIYEKVL